MIVEGPQERVVGVHYVGPEASETIQICGVAMNAGACKKEFDETIAIHPSAAEEFVLMTNKRPAKAE